MVYLLVCVVGCSRPSPDRQPEATEPSGENDVPPSTDKADLERRAGDLFQAVVTDDPARGESFWFPREPFIPLKDPPDPAGYWTKLHNAYVADIHAIHAARPSWDGAVFDHFELGDGPRWMKPGTEHNRIGYYRSLGGSLHYRVGEVQDQFAVDAIITWQGRWYVTHLRRVRR